MPQQSAGHLIAASLEAHGVDRVFSVPGESYLDLLDGLHDSAITNVVCRQEGGATYMAEAVGKATGRPGVAMVTCGPGAANSFVGLHLAWQDATPLVLFVGLVPVNHRDREAFQEFDPRAWFGTQAKEVFILDEADRASEYVARAFHIASTGRPGPVIIGVPEDVLTHTADAPVIPPIPVAEGAVSDDDLDELTAALNAAERPAILLGGPRWTPEAAALITAFAENNNIPVLSDWRAADRIPADSPVKAGETGYGHGRFTTTMLDDADLLLILGGTLSDVPTDGFTLRQGLDEQNWIINPDPELRQHSGAVTRHLVASPVAFGRAVADLRLDPATDWSAWTGTAVEEHRATVAFTNPGENREGTANMTLVMKPLREKLPEDADVTFGPGNHTAWAHSSFPLTTYPSQFSVRNGAMGYAVPAATAVSLTFPDRLVVSVAGDGEFQMTGQELATAVQFGAKFLVLVVDNAQYGTIRSHQEAHYPGRISGTQLANPDFAALARAYGAYGATLDDNDDVDKLLDEALAAVKEGRPALLHVTTDRSLVLPQP